MDKKLKIIAYTAITLFSVAFMAVIGLTVINPIIQRSAKKEKQQIKESEHYKAISDSLGKAAKVAVDSIWHDKISDSLAYVKEKESLKVVYYKKIKSYEAKNAAVDSMPVNDVKRSFSVRKMLSDSSCSVW